MFDKTHVLLLYLSSYLTTHHIQRARDVTVRHHYLPFFTLILLQEIGLYFSFTSQVKVLSPSPLRVPPALTSFFSRHKDPVVDEILPEHRQRHLH